MEIANYGYSNEVLFMVLPAAFLLMSIRIIWNNYLLFFKSVEIVDPETQELQEITETAQAAKNPTGTPSQLDGAA